MQERCNFVHIWGCQTQSKSQDWVEFVALRAVLATTNEFGNDIKKMCLEKWMEKK